jgi:zinc transport system substrate-binding protein
MRLKYLAFALAALSWTLPQAALADPPVVVASIKPVYSLVAGVMAGMGTPVLIVHGAASPHDYSLRAEDARALDAARPVFWVGPGMESFLVKPLQALSGRTEIVEFDRAPGVTTLPARIGGMWEPEPDAPAGSGNVDGHLWLDIDNAKVIVRLAAERLAALDPGNAARYDANARDLESPPRRARPGIARRLLSARRQALCRLSRRLSISRAPLCARYGGGDLGRFRPPARRRANR